MKLNKYIILSILFIIGFVFRIILSSFTINYLIGDMELFDHLAKTVLSGNWAADCCEKTAGYSLFLALLYRLFGSNNLFAVRIVQSLMDCITGLFIYILTAKINHRSAVFSYILYLTNPLTSSVTGLRLSETLTLFLIIIYIYIISLTNYPKKGILYFAGGIISGIVVFTRLQFNYYIAIFSFLTVILLIPKTKIIRYLLLTLTGFICASAYSLMANYVIFHQITIIPPNHRGSDLLYIHFFYNFRAAEIISDLQSTPVNDGYKAVQSDYSIAALDQNLMPEFRRKYSNLLRDKLKSDWPVFITNSFINSVYIWDKYHLYYYEDPFYPKDLIPVRIYNIVLLLLFSIGIITYFYKHKLSSLKQPIFLFTITFLSYILILFPLVSAESRHTLPIYPLIMVWCGYGIIYPYRLIKNIL
jgi:hypothetical protein